MPYSAYPILIVDDDQSSLFHLEASLKKADLPNVLLCQDSRQVCTLLEQQPIAIVLLDLVMPHLSGEELLAKIQHDFPQVPVIIVTGTGEVDTAVRCIKLGAFDYVVKPVDLARLSKSVRNALELRQLHNENQALREGVFSPSLANAAAFKDIVTNSSSMLALFRYAELIAGSSEPVLITGETGVGKELLVQVIHDLSALPGPFVTINVAGLDDNMFSDTLFGHARGAFTGAERKRSGLVERASGGTLFLDEIGDLTPASQAKLLRLLQDGSYLPLGHDQTKYSNARVISATNCDIWALAQQGCYRKDLNFRLRTHHIHIPPLRERKEDLPLLIECFLGQAAKQLNREVPVVSDELLAILENYAFPGNIRELRAVLFNALSVTQGPRLSLQPLRQQLARSPSQVADDRSLHHTEALDLSGNLPTFKEATDLLIKKALQRSNGNQTLAGQMLGISQQAVSKRLKNLGKEQTV